MTPWQEECARRTAEAVRNRENNAAVYVADFTKFDAGKAWNPEPIEEVFCTWKGDDINELENVLSKYERVHKAKTTTTVDYYVK